MDTVIKTVNFIRASALNHREFLAFLEEGENEYGEITDHTNVRWLSRGSVLERFFDLLNETKLFMEKGRNIEEMNDERWITDLAFLVDETGNLNNLNKELQGKDKLIADKYNNIKVFKVNLRLWENQLPICITISRPSESSLDCGKTN
jgi:hypothetical protein